MGSLYRRTKKDKITGETIEFGPWWMKYYDHGKPFRQSTGQYEKQEAKKVLTKAENKVLEGQREGSRTHRTKFEDLIEDLRRDYSVRGYKTWVRRQYCLKHLHPMFNGMRVRAITTERVQQYVDRRLEEGAAPGTINRELDCLHRMMVIGSQQTPPKVAKVPHFPRLAENNVREGFLEHDEFLAVRGAAADHLKVPITIAYYTGMRLREIISDKGIRWDQVELSEQSGCIRLAARQTKTKQPRVIYMVGDFLRVMLKAKELQVRDYPHCPYVCHYNGESFDKLNEGWQAACERVGLKDKRFHDLRRTGVRNLIRAGVPETVAMKISGHKSRRVFDRYNITSEEDLKQAAIKLGQHIEEKKGTLSGTLEGVSLPSLVPSASQPIDLWGREQDLPSRMREISTVCSNH